MSEQTLVRTATAESSEKSHGPRRWWQWFLIYPGLAVALLSAAPTYIEAIKSYQLDVPYGQSQDALQQNRLWQANFACAQKANFISTINRKQVEVGSVVCESGDVLLRAKRPEWDQPQIRWVSWNEVVASRAADNDDHAFLGFISAAHAMETKQAEPTPMVVAQTSSAVLCQRWVGEGRLLQRIKTSAGCFDQVINTFNGLVLDSRPVACNTAC